jgi:hypothetical protein
MDGCVDLESALELAGKILKINRVTVNCPAVCEPASSFPAILFCPSPLAFAPVS